jgi:hypothetical protein
MQYFLIYHTVGTTNLVHPSPAQWAWHVARTGNNTSACRPLVVNAQGRKVGNQSVDRITMKVKIKNGMDMECIHSTRQKRQWRDLVKKKKSNVT